MAPEKTPITAGPQPKNAFPFYNGAQTASTSVNLHAPRTGPPPPVPPRQTQSYSGYNDYRPYYGNGNYYNNYSYRNYGGYNGYGGYNSYNYSPYSSFPGYGYGGAPSGDVESRFFRNAEESTRATFRMVETIVQTFSSLTMLLESTYCAIMNSFRAILNVAENIARLRSTVSQLFSTFALIRFIKWLYRKVMGIKGPSTQDLSEDDLWKKCSGLDDGSDRLPSLTWSGLLMFSVFFVIPYLIHKISTNIKNLQAKGSDPEQWNKFEEPVYTATVLYDFTAGNEDELTVKAGQKIWLAPQSLQPVNYSGWYRATDHRSVGLVPANYVQVVGQLVKKPKVESTVQEPIKESTETWRQSVESTKQFTNPKQSFEPITKPLDQTNEIETVKQSTSSDQFNQSQIHSEKLIEDTVDVGESTGESTVVELKGENRDS